MSSGMKTLLPPAFSHATGLSGAEGQRQCKHGLRRSPIAALQVAHGCACAPAAPKPCSSNEILRQYNQTQADLWNATQNQNPTV